MTLELSFFLYPQRTLQKSLQATLRTLSQVDRRRIAPILTASFRNAYAPSLNDMSIQLSGSCFRSLQQTGHRTTLPFASRFINTLRARRDIHLHRYHPLLFTCTRHRPPFQSLPPPSQPYATAALRTTAPPTSPDTRLTTTEAEAQFLTSLQDIHLAGAAWNAYTLMPLPSKQNMHIQKYEQFMSTLYTLARSKRRSVQWRRLRQIYEDIKQLGIPRTKPVMLMAMAAYGRTGSFEQAEMLFKELKQQDLADGEVYQHMIRSALDCNVLQPAFATLEEGIAEHQLQGESLYRCIDHFVRVSCSKNNVPYAMRAVRKILSLEPVDQMFTPLLQSMANDICKSYIYAMKKCDFGSGLDMEITASSASWEIFANEYVKRIAWDSRQKIFTSRYLGDLFELLIKAYPSIAPTATMCDTVLRAVAQTRDRDFAKQILIYMKQHGIQPTRATVQVLQQSFVANTPAPSCTDMDGMDEWAVVRKMVQDHQFDRASLFLKSSGYYDKALKKQAEGNEALNIALEPFATILESLLQHGHWNKCVQLYKTWEKDTISRVLDTNRRIPLAALAARISRGDFPGLRHMVQNMRIEMTRKSILRVTLAVLNLKRENVKLVPGHLAVRGMQTMEDALGIRVGLKGIARVIEKLGERGDINIAYKLYLSTISAVRSGIFPATKTMSGIHRIFIEAAIANNDMSKVEEAWLNMVRRSHLPSCQRKTGRPELAAYNMLLNCYASRYPTPHLAKLTRIFQRLLTDGHTPNNVTYNIIIKAFVYNKNPEAAYSTFRRMVEAGVMPDNYTVNTMLQGWVAQGEWGRTVNFIKALKKSNIQVELDVTAFNLLVQGFLHLDHRKLSHLRMLKLQGDFATAKQLTRRWTQHGPYPLSSGMLWDIFESAIGLKPSDVLRGHALLSEQEQLRILQYTQSGEYQDLWDTLIKLTEKPTSKHASSFINMFAPCAGNSMKPDDITFKLFIKAFLCAGNMEAASAIHHYLMTHVS